MTPGETVVPTCNLTHSRRIPIYLILFQPSIKARRMGVSRWSPVDSFDSTANLAYRALRLGRRKSGRGRRRLLGGGIDARALQLLPKKPL